MSKDDFILETEGIYKSYRMGATEVKVLKGVDLAVRKGEFVAIVGPSGSGKSTLLHILGALDNPDIGTVKFDGKDVPRIPSGISNFTYVFIGSFLFAFIIGVVYFGYRIPLAIAVAVLATLLTIWGSLKEPSVLTDFRNKKVGFVFQFYHLLDELSVLENVFLPVMASRNVVGWFACRRWAKSRARELLVQLGLRDRADHKPYQLAGGERQRVAIGRALMNEPRLLLADEPTGNLDSATGNDILAVLEELNRAGQTIIMVTHDERIAQRAGRIITLTDGKISG